MRALLTLCAAALLFAAGCSKTDDTADNPTPPADQTAPAPADQPAPVSPSDTTVPPPADDASPPSDQQPTPPQ
jgi:ABC-type oligopeptide transport system substrate-binding subunit